MPKFVETRLASSSHYISLSALNEIDKYNSDFLSLFYVKNHYNPDFYGFSATLFRFKIVKETNCFYFLKNGQRIHKTLNNLTYATSPRDAVDKALKRADNYLDILIRRGTNVSNFLKTAKADYKANTSELREFAKIANQFIDLADDDVPLDLPKHSIDPSDPRLKRDAFE